jgi:hypothetical protein
LKLSGTFMIPLNGRDGVTIEMTIATGDDLLNGFIPLSFFS